MILNNYLLLQYINTYCFYHTISLMNKFKPQTKFKTEVYLVLFFDASAQHKIIHTNLQQPLVYIEAEEEDIELE